MERGDEKEKGKGKGYRGWAVISSLSCFLVIFFLDFPLFLSISLLFLQFKRDFHHFYNYQLSIINYKFRGGTRKMFDFDFNFRCYFLHFFFFFFFDHVMTVTVAVTLSCEL